MEQLRDNIGSRALETNVIDRDDVGMVERGGGPSFLFEAAQMIGIVAGSGANQLQRNVAPQPLVMGPKDFAHTSLADFFDDSVVPNPLADHREHTGAAPRLGMLGAKSDGVNTAYRDHSAAAASRAKLSPLWNRFRNRRRRHRLRVPIAPLKCSRLEVASPRNLRRVGGVPVTAKCASTRRTPV